MVLMSCGWAGPERSLRLQNRGQIALWEGARFAELTGSFGRRFGEGSLPAAAIELRRLSEPSGQGVLLISSCGHRRQADRRVPSAEEAEERDDSLVGPAAVAGGPG